MLQERRSRIIEKIQKEQVVKVSQLMEEFGVSIETIRRDLEYLEKHDYLKRVYGGAVLRGLSSQEPAYERRRIANEDKKQAIARRAAALVQDGDTVFVDVGTTTLETVRQLKGKMNLTIITNSTLAAQTAVQDPGARVILLGGEIRRGDLSVSGYLCDNSLENFYANKALVGAGGVSAGAGITDYHLAEANTRRLMISRADQVIVVADSSKFGVVAMNRVCPIGQVDVLVTDKSADALQAENIRAQGVELLVCEE